MPTSTQTRQTKARTKAATSHKYFSLEKTATEANIVIYGDVTSWPWFESDVSSYNLSKQIEALDVDTINVGINSYGGEIGEGLAIYNALKRHRAKVRTRCDGFACSIASVIFMAGDERVMADPSMLMIHNGWTSATGDAKALRKQADDIEKMTEASVQIYMQHATIEEEELRALMDAETWISPEEAVDMGLATSIEGADTSKPSQCVRKKVMQMLRNPYRQLEDDPDDPDRNPDEEPDTTGDPSAEPDGTDEEPDTTDTSDDGDATDGDSTDGDTGTDDTSTDPDQNPDDTDPDPDDEDEQKKRDKRCENQMLRFLKAIQHM